MHLVDMERNTIAGNAIVGAHWVLVTGAGFAAKMKGNGAIAAGFGGEGSTNRGTFHEGINLAAVKKLPVLFVCENNRKQLWNDISETTAVENIASRAAAYNIPGKSVDGNDPVAIFETAVKFAEKARNGEGPSVLECRTFKWRDSGNNVRLEKEDVEKWKAEQDPVLLFKKRLEEMNVLDNSEDDKIRSRVTDKLEKAVAYGKKGRDPLPEEAVEDVYSMPADVKSGGGVK
jgi:TPP-dependent pyruvate/acetoin dehydrogenase alpha subunit